MKIESKPGKNLIPGSILNSLDFSILIYVFTASMTTYGSEGAQGGVPRRHLIAPQKKY